jgi:hypothetical protein
VTALSAGLLLATSSRMPIVWDEGDTIERAEQLIELARASGAEGRPTFFQAVREPRNWPFTIQREGHPPLAALLIAAGSSLAPSALDPLTRDRLGPILFFSIALGAMFYRLQRDYRTLAVSLMAVVILLQMPRVFAHAHYTTLDAPLTAAWLLAWAAFAPACRDLRLAPLFGLTLGLTLAAKFTGWLAPLPFAVWALCYRDRRAACVLAIGVPIAVLIFVALNPPLWSEPLAGLRTFFDLNLHRGARPEHNVSTLFFGHMYNLDYPLPWYNTLVWTAITISPVPLMLGIGGIYVTLRRPRFDPAGVLLVCQWATLIIVRAVPGTPPHDAERLILPSFAFFAALAGVGLGRGLYRGTLLDPPGQRIVAQGWARVVLAFALAAPTFDIVGYFPHGLSYYNRLIGGLRGATSLGMEPTYYWDSLDRDALDWLADHTADDERVAFEAAPPANLRLLHRWGLLRPLSDEPGRFRWYVMQRRPSAYQLWNHWLINHAQPEYQSALSGVPLLDIYDYDDYLRARAETEWQHP